MSNKECSDDLYERFVKKYNKRECKGRNRIKNNDLKQTHKQDT
jgi:hypothetical protein